MADRCTCANDGNASRCPHHTQADFDSARTTDTETLAEVLAAAFEDHHWCAEVSPPEGVTPYLWCICGWRSDDATDAHWASGEHARLAHAHVAEHTAARIVQARAGEGALREACERLADKFALLVEGNKEVNDAGARSYIAAEKMLRAALTASDGTSDGPASVSDADTADPS